MQLKVNIFWFRRDLRLDDNTALYHALKPGLPVVPLFIFDKHILDQLEEKADRRVAFIHDALHQVQKHLLSLESSLEVYHDYPENVFKHLLEKYSIDTVFANHDFELYALDRDEKIRQLLSVNGIGLKTFKDHVIFEKNEIAKPNGEPYTVFTPYSKTWLRTLNDKDTRSYPVEEHFSNFYNQTPLPIPSLQQIGFNEVGGSYPAKEWNEEIIKHYTGQRDFPGMEGTSKMGVHLRFGTISIRRLVAMALQTNATYLNELVWREFYQAILWHFPHVAKGLAFKPAYDHIEWRNNEAEFERWCQGMTGYPIVDAGMREINATGFMHNRVRMITASFLVKHLLIDWRWGEAYFAQKLLDYEFASNNGGWQWAAGSGCDAAPYFRIFNPYLQTKKFDKDLVYIRKWVPELEEMTYPKPMVDHELARKRALETYVKALKN